MPGRMIKPAIRKAALARFEAGESGPALAAEYGFHPTLIYKWRERGHGLRSATEHGRLLAREIARMPPQADGRAPTKPATRETVRVAARRHAPRALETLAAVMEASQSETARIAAAKAILDRAERRRQPEAEPRATEDKPAVTRIEFVFVDPKR